MRAFPGTWCVPCCLVLAVRSSLVIAFVDAGVRILLSDTAPVSCARVCVGRRLDPSCVCVRRWRVPPRRFVAAGPGAAFLWPLVRVFCACVRAGLSSPSLCSALGGGFINHLQL